MDRYEPLGCTEHKFMHEDHEILVDECVCKEDRCNEAMGPIPTPSTTTPKTTPKGIQDIINNSSFFFIDASYLSYYFIITQI